MYLGFENLRVLAILHHFRNHTPRRFTVRLFKEAHHDTTAITQAKNPNHIYTRYALCKHYHHLTAGEKKTNPKKRASPEKEDGRFKDVIEDSV